MKFSLVTLVLFFASSQLIAQNNKSYTLTGEHDQVTLVKPEVPTHFPGGNDSLRGFIERNNNWKVGRETTVGKVFVEFMVEKDGSVTNIEVLKGLNESCDEEAKRIVSILPKFKPGEQSNVPVRMRMVLPITFDGMKYEQKCEAQRILTNQFSGVSLGPYCNFFQDLNGQFQPNLKQIIQAEEGMQEQLYELMIEHPQIGSKYAIKNPTKHYQKWERQYYGYENELGEQIIAINLLDFGARNAKKWFEGWTEDFIIGFGGFYEENTRTYTYNLITGEFKI